MFLRLQRPQLSGTVKEHGADVTDSLGRIKALWANIHAILDPMAPEHAERIIKFGKTVLGSGIPAVRQKAVCLQ